MEPKTVETLVVLGVPHVMFVFIWFLPKQFQRLCKPLDAVPVFAALASLLKGTARPRGRGANCGRAIRPTPQPAAPPHAVAQLAAIYRWHTSFGPLNWDALALWQYTAAALLIGFGQALNAGIYRAIGKNGVRR